MNEEYMGERVVEFPVLKSRSSEVTRGPGCRHAHNRGRIAQHSRRRRLNLVLALGNVLLFVLLLANNLDAYLFPPECPMDFVQYMVYGGEPQPQFENRTSPSEQPPVAGTPSPLARCGYPVDAFSFLVYPSWQDFFAFPDDSYHLRQITGDPDRIVARKNIISAKKEQMARFWHPDNSALTGLPPATLQHIWRMILDMEVRARSEVALGRHFTSLVQQYRGAIDENRTRRRLAMLGRQPGYWPARLLIRMRRLVNGQAEVSNLDSATPAEVAEFYKDEANDVYPEQDAEEMAMEELRKQREETVHCVTYTCPGLMDICKVNPNRESFCRPLLAACSNVPTEEEDW